MAKAKYIERIRLNQEECRKAKEEYEVEENFSLKSGALSRL